MEQSSGDRDVVRLYQAARCSDIGSVKQICAKKGAKFVTEPLGGAAAGGHLDVVRWLPESGALLNGKDGKGCTALHLAARRGQLGVVSEILCRSDCVVGEKDQSGCTALHMAAKQGHVDVVKRLVSKGACVNDTNGCGRAALHMAIGGQHISVVEYLVEMGALVDGKDDSGQAPLYLAAGKGLLGVVKLIVSAGAKVNETNQGGATAAHAAAEGGHLAVMEWLVRNGAGVGMTNDLGQTILHRALKAADENYTLVRFLVHLGLHPFELDTHGSTSLSYAIAKRKFRIVEYFLKECSNGMMPSAKDLRRAVFDATKADQAHILELLLTPFGFDLWRTTRDGRSGLHEAAATGAINCVKFLLSRGGNGSQQPDNRGTTPIIESSRNGHLSVLTCLLESGGSTSAVDCAGRTALHYAAESGHTSVVGQLLAHGAGIDCQDKRGWTSLHCAAADGRLEVVKLLVDHGSDSNLETVAGQTSLLLARNRGHSAVFRYLKEKCPLGTRTLTSISPEAAVRANYKEYLVDLSDMDLAWAPRGRERSKGSWLGSPVEVKMKYNTNVVEELDRWSKVNHPHVVKLFGVCCEEKVPLFVYERPAHESLLEYRKNLTEKDVLTEMWSKLYEAGLGLEYLYDQGIIHGDIRCESIAVAKSGAAKWRNLGFEKTTSDDRVPWTAPEVLSGLQPLLRQIFSLSE